VHALSKAIEVAGNAVGIHQVAAAIPELRTRARSRTAVWLAVHCQAVGHVLRSEGAGVTKEGRAFARRGVEPRERGAVEHRLCMKNTAAEYAQFVWLRAVRAVRTAVRYVPTSARSEAGQGRAYREATRIAGRRERKVRPNTSFKRTRNGMAPGPRGRLVYHRPRGPGSTPLRAA
jgi:hypothetical protein